MEGVRREIFWNIDTFPKIIFYILALATIALFIYGFLLRVFLWRKGKKDDEKIDYISNILGALKQIFLQAKVIRETFPGLSHLFLFYGFLLLFTGTVLVLIEYDVGHLILGLKEYFMLKGSFYIIFSFTLELAGISLLFGSLFLFIRRYFVRPEQVESVIEDFFVLLSLFIVGITGFIVEGYRIKGTGSPPFEKWSFVGWWISKLIKGEEAKIKFLHEVFWWIHASFAFALIVYIPLSKFKHIFFVPLNIVFRSAKPRGMIRSIDIEKAETYGAGKFSELSWRYLLSVDACMRCGRCQVGCPAFTTQKPLNPKWVIQKILRCMEEDKENLIPDPVQPDEMWSCTTCAYCVEQCPAFISHVDIFVEMRRWMIMQNLLSGTGAKALQKAMNSGNPWGLPQNERESWIGEMKVKRARDGNFDYLYWVGCAGSYDPRNQKVARNFVNLLSRLGVNFAILGNEEKCTGDFARRLGEEGLFQMLAMENIQTLKKYGVKKIITACPHCYNTFKNEYPSFGGDFEVYHHTEFLFKLLSERELKISVKLKEVLTYHDPCYLGRYNGIYEEPREIVKMVSEGELREMKNSFCKSYCCGGGGGHSFMDINIGKRINYERFEQALSLNPDRIIVACPFCLMMFDDACKFKNMEEKIRIQDISELVGELLRDF